MRSILVTLLLGFMVVSVGAVGQGMIEAAGDQRGEVALDETPRLIRVPVRTPDTITLEVVNTSEGETPTEATVTICRNDDSSTECLSIVLPVGKAEDLGGNLVQWAQQGVPGPHEMIWAWEQQP